MTQTGTAPAPQAASLGRSSWKLWINGEPVDAASGETFTTYNPATNETLAQVAKAGKADVDRAVQAARAAFDGGKWPRTSAARRGSLLNKV
ncbi:MAG TPA: aldehyde dehydrogenase family protein, partial [Chloroflexia bacterium]|nr:aldehyde dehydrogenase family protein [Chloroflexia bacterium]